MKKEEVKITSFQAENYRLQLIYVTKELRKSIKKIYEVRENRKVVCSSVKYDDAAAVYIRCINDKLNCNITTGEPDAIMHFKGMNGKLYYGKYKITNDYAEKLIKSGKYFNLGGLMWEKSK